MTPTATAARPAGGRRPTSRKVALLGGTTTAGDCAVGVRVLTNPRHLVQGPTLSPYEEALARREGERYAISFSSGRVGL